MSNGFDRACPNGNTLIDCGQPFNGGNKSRIFTHDKLRKYIRNNSFSFGDIRSIVECFNSEGFLDIEE